mmetsp:Transcript_63409/g.206745  ORF Transcript_63409/g.206745 Transcript_63409/m.206745 type:complete len:438 (+) Transcript_63409:100-1413(+)
MVEEGQPQVGGKRRWRRAAAPGGAGERSGEVVGDLAAPPSESSTAVPPPPGPPTAPEQRRSPADGGSFGRGRGRGRELPGAVRTPLGLAAGAYNEGARLAFAERYVSDLKRLQDRHDLLASARWLDSHCHLESILARTWRGGGKPQVTEHEPLVGLPELVASWPPGLDGCICNCAFRRPSKPGFPPEWAWIESNLSHFEPSSPISDKLWFTIGIHPHDADNWDDVAERVVRRLGAHPKCVGIGECGIDFFKHDKSEAEKQVRVFRAQAKLAVELGKALVVHARLVTPENEDMCLRVLEETVPQDHPIHIHCFGDSLEHARQLIERWPRLRIGFTGAITFRDRASKSGGKPSSKAKGKGGVEEKKGEEHCRELVQGLPLERLLIETDGPYMCPEPFRGQTAHPGHVHRVAERIADWHARPLSEVMAATRQSTRVVYGI